MRRSLNLVRAHLSLAPAAPAMVALAVALGLACWAGQRALAAGAAAERAEQNLAQARRAADVLRRVAPAHMPPDGPRRLIAALERDVRAAAGADDGGAISSTAMQSLGGLTDVPSVRQQARIELTGLRLAHVAAALDSVEGGDLPCWVDSLDLTAAGGEGDQWNAVLHVQWLSSSAAPAVVGRP